MLYIIIIMYYIVNCGRIRHSDGRREIAKRKTAKTQQWRSRAEELAAVRVDLPDPGTHTHFMRVLQYVCV